MAISRKIKRLAVREILKADLREARAQDAQRRVNELGRHLSKVNREIKVIGERTAAEQSPALWRELSAKYSEAAAIANEIAGIFAQVTQILEAVR